MDGWQYARNRQLLEQIRLSAPRLHRAFLIVNFMVIFKDKYARVGRVKPVSTLKLPLVSANRKKIRFTFTNGNFYINALKARITKENAFNLAKWILSHE